MRKLESVSEEEGECLRKRESVPKDLMASRLRGPPHPPYGPLGCSAARREGREEGRGGGGEAGRDPQPPYGPLVQRSAVAGTVCGGST